MKITLESTPEMFDVKLRDGRTVPTRVWIGKTEGDVVIEAYVFSITPFASAELDRFKAELPDYMRPTRDGVEIEF